MYPLPAGKLRFTESIDFHIRFGDWEPWSERFYRENSDCLEDIQHDLMPAGIERSIRTRQLLGNGMGYNGVASDERLVGTRRLAAFGSEPDGPQFWGESAVPVWYMLEEDLREARFDKAMWGEG